LYVLIGELEVYHPTAHVKNPWAPTSQKLKFKNFNNFFF
jgi:hypothetical protein